MNAPKRRSSDRPTIAVVDIFCGAGGLTHGLIQEDLNVVAGLDSDGSCRYAYEHNNRGAKFIHQDIESVDAQDISSLYPNGALKVLVGCAPCQPFSSYTKKQRPPGEKWKLLASFADLIEAVDPAIVSMENVVELENFNHGTIYGGFVARLEKLGHQVTSYHVYCPDYGVPQHRRRLVLFASKRGAISLVQPTHTKARYKTVKDAIRHLPPVNAGSVDSIDPCHRARALDDVNMRRIRQSRPGGSWEDWDAELRSKCHVKASGGTFRSVYGRMTWNEPAPTITTQSHAYGTGRFGHPEQDRALTLREAAILQTFPPHYEFVGPDDKWSLKTVARHIGNAVPPALGQVIARSIKRHLEEYDG